MGQRAANEPETAAFLRSIVDSAMDSSGISEWADNNTYNELRAYAN
jgi:hypothetical protein